ncbi:hypothetical protein OIU76_016550 [Salix suchowensis]|nr:hypothetical protein OIU76_016550 [Salix suchowensis]
MRNPSSSSSARSRSTPATPCCGKVGIKRGPWTPEEDEILANYIHKDEENARFDRAIATRVIDNFPLTNLDQFPNQVINDDGAENRPSGDGFNKGSVLQSRHEQNEEEDYTGYENEDTFSLFLDSLINENVFMYQEQQQLQQPNNIPVPSGEPVISSSQAIHHGSSCEAEVSYSMAAFGEKDGVLNSHDLA